MKWKLKEATRRLTASNLLRDSWNREPDASASCAAAWRRRHVETSTSFGHVLPDFARDRQVIAFEQQGYGHTADIVDRPFGFEQSADDTRLLCSNIST